MNERTAAYAASLSQMIKHETISELGQTDKTKFLEFHKLMRELFPRIFSVCSFCSSVSIADSTRGRYSSRMSRTA